MKRDDKNAETCMPQTGLEKRPVDDDGEAFERTNKKDKDSALCHTPRDVVTQRGGDEGHDGSGACDVNEMKRDDKNAETFAPQLGLDKKTSG